MQLESAVRSVHEIFHFHAHIYFEDEAQRAAAMRLRALIAERFLVDMGRIFDAPVGPHPAPQYEIGFHTEIFAQLLPWLMLNRCALSIMVHPNTDLELADHADSAVWLGEALPLSYTRLQVSLKASGQDAPRDVAINTQPSLSP